MAALFVVACAGSPAQPTEAPRAPATLAIAVVDGAPLPGTRMELRATLTRHGVWNAPVSFDVRVPPGARLVSQTAVAGDGSELVLELATVPVEDLVVTASSQTEGAGFHAEARYRFGRPEPVKAPPPRAAESVSSPGGADLGAPVRMK